ncbi:hypothetical protein TNCV_2732441 [Trichonephila clavipes]|nr:hypothetical protein TNCV_2732441 [Trichonephila clavipes]
MALRITVLNPSIPYPANSQLDLEVCEQQYCDTTNRNPGTLQFDLYPSQKRAVLYEGDTRNRWRDGPVCPDVDEELWRLEPDSSGHERKKETEKKDPERERKRPRERENKIREKSEEDRRKKGQESPGEREREARLEWRKRLSPEIGVKRTNERRWR